MLLLRYPRALFAQMLEERFGFQFGGGFQHRFGFGPNPAQRVGARSPGVLGLEFSRGLARPHVFARGGAAGIGFQGTDSDVPVGLCSFMSRWYCCLVIIRRDSPETPLVSERSAAKSSLNHRQIIIVVTGKF